jgi:hypothetical protein
MPTTEALTSKTTGALPKNPLEHIPVRPQADSLEMLESDVYAIKNDVADKCRTSGL